MYILGKSDRLMYMYNYLDEYIRNNTLHVLMYDVLVYESRNVSITRSDLMGHVL